MGKIKKEHETILLLLKPELDEIEVNRLNELMRTHMDWAEVIGLIQTHKIAGVCWKSVNSYVSEHEDRRFTYPSIIDYLKTSHKIQSLKAKEQVTHLFNICDELEKQGINYVLLKGIVLSGCVYNDFGVRDFNDNDLLVHPNQLKECLEIIKDMGYTQGGVSPISKKIFIKSRKEIITRPLISHEVIPLIKKTENSLLDYHMIDLHFSINLMTGDRTDSLVFNLLNQSIRVKIDKYYFNTLDWNHHLIFLCIHFYKEATTLRDVLLYKDLMLIKLSDIHHVICMLARSEDWDANDFLMFVNSKNYIKEVYYTLYYLKVVFGDTLIRQFIEQLHIKDDKFLSEVYRNGDMVYRWEDDIIDRVFNMNRPSFLNK